MIINTQAFASSLKEGAKIRKAESFTLLEMISEVVGLLM